MEIEDPPLSCWKKCLYFICGLSQDVSEEKKTAEEQKEHLREVISLKQDRKTKRILIINSVILMVISVFLIVFYTVPDGGPTAPTISFPYLPFVNNGTRPYWGINASLGIYTKLYHPSLISLALRRETHYGEGRLSVQFLELSVICIIQQTWYQLTNTN